MAAKLDSGVIEAPEFFNFARDVIGRWAAERPDAPALWCVDIEGRETLRLTFQQLAARAEAAAQVFRSHGLQPGDRVLVVLPRIPQWWIAMLGMIRAGVVPVPCPVQLTPGELAYRAETAGARGTITDSTHLSKLEGFVGIRFLIGESPGGWLDFEAEMKKHPEPFGGETTRGDAPGILYFTSATTGQPKMVLHTQASYGLGHRQTGELWLDLKPGDVHWNVSDLGWAKAAWSSLFGPWQMGACVFAADNRGKFLPHATLQLLENFPITTWCAPPTALRLIIRENLASFRFPKLRHCVSAGEPLNPEIISLWQSATGLGIYEGYGQTETVVLIGNFRRLGHSPRAGSMGRANPNFEIALLDEELRELPADSEGEIAIRLKPRRPLGLFREYWKNPAQNAAQFRGDYYLTGDRARRDAEGCFWFVGRADDVIKSSGYRIGPAEVESVLLEHPSVLDVAVVGKPDALRGQLVKAFVVLRPGYEAGEHLAASLQSHCREKAAPYKYPREIEFVPDLPKTTSGKIRRVELRARS